MLLLLAFVGIIKKISILGIVYVWEITAPGPELPRIFCVGIGPLQLGIALVFQINKHNTKLQRVDPNTKDTG